MLIKDSEKWIQIAKQNFPIRVKSREKAYFDILYIQQKR